MRQGLQVLLLFVFCGAFLFAADAPEVPGLRHTEFIFEKAPFASCHASTIVETSQGLVAAWFGGTRESAPDVGIWCSRQVQGVWTPPVEIANGVQPDGSRFSSWNPVLFQPRRGPLMLFYKVGVNPRTWWGMLCTSSDGGATWSTPRRLPEGILGPIKNKPIQLPNGDLLCPSSTERDRDNGTPTTPEWQVHFERTTDLGQTWSKVRPSDPGAISAIQPSLLSLRGESLLALGRTRRTGHIFSVRSDDGGRSWGRVGLILLPNPGSGTDAVTLADGRHLLVYNHTDQGRSPLNLAISSDGTNWQATLVLETEPKQEFSYPAIIQGRDGVVHIVYTWKRLRIRHRVVDPQQLQPQDFVHGKWPSPRPASPPSP